MQPILLTGNVANLRVVMYFPRFLYNKRRRIVVFVCAVSWIYLVAVRTLTEHEQSDYYSAPRLVAWGDELAHLGNAIRSIGFDHRYCKEMKGIC